MSVLFRKPFKVYQDIAIDVLDEESCQGFEGTLLGFIYFKRVIFWGIFLRLLKKWKKH